MGISVVARIPMTKNQKHLRTDGANPLAARLAELDAQKKAAAAEEEAIRSVAQHLLAVRQSFGLFPQLQELFADELMSLTGLVDPDGDLSEIDIRELRNECDDETADLLPHTLLGQIRHFFDVRDNDPATIGAICSHTGRSESAVRNAMYIRHKEWFVKVSGGGGGKPTYWRLATNKERAERMDVPMQSDENPLGEDELMERTHAERDASASG